MKERNPDLKTMFDLYLTRKLPSGLSITFPVSSTAGQPPFTPA
jgi:hypothetical protein